ncbi:4Fe-4S dicluster domain-containing protein [Candidatus Bathyarchaeota archaeon]|nr:4Fe-4S dicluster domain-containing protein [Candidatus Bathyarchaeota archaeon]
MQSNKLFFDDSEIRINVGMSTCGLAAGANPVYTAFKEAVEENDVSAKVVNVGCIGACFAEPLVEIFTLDKPGVFYSNVNPDNAKKIILDYVSGKIDNAWAIREYSGAYSGELNLPRLQDHPFFKPQVRDAIENCGIIDPESIDEYICYGGYKALEKALKKTPEEVIETVIESGLRGRGGAGFPTGLKWKFTRPVESEKKYVICNADEGDPGAFMNRLNAEGDPHKILEGLIIAAYTVGAEEGFFFVRAEKPLMGERLKKAIESAMIRGYLGDNILDSGFSFKADVILSAGAFVCGEETALMRAIEGKRAMPTPRPPFPSTKGLWGKPTCINNVETLAHVPKIINEGPEAFAAVGSEKSKGTKVFCLTGAIERSGAVEVPLGTSIRTLVFDIGGGPHPGRSFKAVQTGGPSGGCLSEKHLDLGLDYESLQSAGSIMGSGGVVVIDDTSCTVDVAKFFLGFTTAESCGQCTPCRIGLKRMHEVLERITEGEGVIEDLELLQYMSKGIIDSSLCALGRSAPNPVLTTIKYFEDEYRAHIEEQSCPAGVCDALIKGYVVEPSDCRGCGLCVKECPENAITQTEPGDKAEINQDHCIKCGNCYTACPFDAIKEVW